MARRKIKILAKQLESVDVEFISLVARGANRIPFRFTKSAGDDDMSIDLGKLFLLKKADKNPEVVGFAVAKEEDKEAVMAMATGMDLSVPVESVEDGIQLMKTEDYDSHDDITVIKLDDSVAMLVANIKKGLSSIPDDNSFTVNIAKAGFAPSMGIATDILMSTMYTILREEGGRNDTVTKITKSLEDYKTYVVAMANAVPEQAFKMESEFVEKSLLNKEGKTNPNAEGDKVPGAEGKVIDGEGKEVDAPTADEPVDEGTAIVDDEAADLAASQAASDQAQADATPEGDVPAAPEAPADDAPELQDPATPAVEGDVVKDVSVADTAPKAQTLDMEALLKGLGTMIDDKLEGITSTLKSDIATISDKVTAIEESGTELGDRLVKAEQKATDAQEAMQGTMLDGAGQTDLSTTAVTRTQKSENDGGLFDTAFGFQGFEQ
ncbi:MAG: hypothetical protein GQ570_03840 [Helicobacteraceae bacterium]|nr:hypothetical protein [Helicobacteraceae bacterium]